ncbi:MAG: transglycosylase SLT domain-containing protein [Candidatus Delongbacteria bacterium]|jgi:membrane-bound lytic murein transglycosylase D|nr:transglycosylase SLT domain-containing protein [Candidatus Delongbacteria bacterium]
MIKHKTYGHILVFLLLASVSPVHADGDDDKDNKESASKNRGFDIILPDSMVKNTQKLCDSLIVSGLEAETQEERIYSAYEASHNDSLIISRLEKLSRRTEIPLTYHASVKEYIQAYGLRNPQKISRILGRSAFYYPIFDHYLNTYKLPPELKHLASVESSLDPVAVSKSGAVGLWQFLPGAAGLFDLQMDAWVDERSDPHKSTDAACRYLSYLYRIFGDWHLAMAAYNGGPGAIQKAMARCGGESNYWKIRHKLSNQMQSYVPAFIAMNYVLHYHRDFNIKPAVPVCYYHQTDTLHVRKKTSLDRVAEVLDIDHAIVRSLNPVYRQGVIPENDNGCVLVLPRTESIAFILNQEIITGEQFIPEKKATKDTKWKAIKYIVQKGDSLHKIAIEHNCTIQDIRRWNNFPKNKPLFYDEEIVLYVE